VEKKISSVVLLGSASGGGGVPGNLGKVERRVYSTSKSRQMSWPGRCTELGLNSIPRRKTPRPNLFPFLLQGIYPTVFGARQI
jgi:hypothetical protein